jgi:hypothetical protein
MPLTMGVTILAILIDSFVWGSAGVRKNLSIGVVISKYREEACLPKPNLYGWFYKDTFNNGSIFLNLKQFFRRINVVRR